MLQTRLNCRKKHNSTCRYTAAYDCATQALPKSQPGCLGDLCTWAGLVAFCFFRALSLSGAWDDVISSSLLHTTPVKREVRGRVTGEERMVCETYNHAHVPAYHSVRCGGWSDVGCGGWSNVGCGGWSDVGCGGWSNVGCGGWSQVYHLKGESYGCRYE